MSRMMRTGALFCAAIAAFSPISGVEGGAPGSRFNPYRTKPGRARRQDCSGRGETWGKDIAPAPTGCGKTGGGGAQEEGGTDVNRPPVSSHDRAAPMLGPVAFTSVPVAEKDKAKFSGPEGTGMIGEDIFGPFEAGFTSQQDTQIQALGCADPSDGYVDGGFDTQIAEKKIAYSCNVKLPRMDANNEYVSILDQCGGHTREYHNHERLICLYDDTAPGHSTKVGEAEDGLSTPLYGKFEGTGAPLPLLDACGGHYGITPDSQGEAVYHYHVQDAPPFTIGCFGPNDDNTLVTVEQCRAFYTGCGDGDEQDVETADGVSISYDRWCPCFDANGANIGTAEPLAVFADANAGTGTGVVDEGAADPPGDTGPSTAHRKNVVLFMPDDLHFFFDEAPLDPAQSNGGEVHNNPYAAWLDVLPNLAKMRIDGATFSQAYVSGPKCAPSRWGMVTGRYPSRGQFAQSNMKTTGVRTYVDVPQTKLGPSDVQQTLQAAMKAGGYRTIMSGKWHISETPSTGAWSDYGAVVADVKASGFDRVASVYEGNLGDGALPFSHNPDWMVSTTLDEMSGAVADNTPFFLYYAPTMPHSAASSVDALNRSLFAITQTPAGVIDSVTSQADAGLQSLASILQKAGQITRPKTPARTLNSIVGSISVDDQLGAIMAKLEQLQIREDTLVIVCQDHGQLSKSTLYEGGTRVMLMAQYPNGIPGGRVVGTAVSNLDIAPSILEFAGLSDTGLQLDGASWLGAASDSVGLVGSQTKTNKLTNRLCIVSEMFLQRALVCGGRAKFISGPQVAGKVSVIDSYPHCTDQIQLYDLDEDPTEQTNLALTPGFEGIVSALEGYMACHDTDTAADGTAAPCNPEATLRELVLAAMVAKTWALPDPDPESPETETEDPETETEDPETETEDPETETEGREDTDSGACSVIRWRGSRMLGAVTCAMAAAAAALP